jgi:hypothetical protein
MNFPFSSRDSFVLSKDILTSYAITSISSGNASVSSQTIPAVNKDCAGSSGKNSVSNKNDAVLSENSPVSNENDFIGALYDRTLNNNFFALVKTH